MEHFNGSTAEERYKNELLNEVRKTNELLSKLISGNAQATVKPESTKRPEKGVVKK